MNNEVKNGTGSNAASRSFPGSGAAIRPASGLLQVSYELMTPGPTQVAENVRQALSLPCVNPDLDPDFYSFTEGICHDLERFFHTEDHQALILSGEGILGIEAAFASMTEPGDRVLVLDNGVYGRGNAIPPTTTPRLILPRWNPILQRTTALPLQPSSIATRPPEC